MDNLINYRLKEFYKQPVELVTEYIDYLAYLSPREPKQELFYMTLKDVQAVRDLMQEGTLDSLREIVMLVQDIDEETVFKMKIVEFFELVRAIKDQIEEIGRAEQSSLIGKAYNQKWEAVDGSARLEKFGIYNVLDKLAGGDILKYDRVLQLIYADVFTKLYRDTVLGDIEYEMSKIKSLNK